MRYTIEFQPGGRVFYLHGPRFTYAPQALPGGEIAHLYWGPRLRARADQEGAELAGWIRPRRPGVCRLPRGSGHPAFFPGHAAPGIPGGGHGGPARRRHPRA